MPQSSGTGSMINRKESAMKKTAQTLLTAAIFATALGSAVPSQFRQPARALEDPIVEVETNLADVYGPPPMFTEPEAAETTVTRRTRRTRTTETTKGTTYTTTTVEPETVPVVLYGPPWVFYGQGDANRDGVSDARDLTIIKQIALNGTGIAESYGYDPRGGSVIDIADVDHDGDVDADDVHKFMEEVLGIPKKEEPAVTTTVPETVPPELTTTSSTVLVTKKTIPGSEVTLDPGILTGLIHWTDAPIVAMYGPPSIGDWDDLLRWDDYEALHPGEHQTTTAPQNQTTKTETVEEANRHQNS